ncbi:MAG: aconitate hydratase AcnA [Propionibacteriaceae bacterium]|jgi:aconitate hydratase|nr:aconitate hydratase AcnA [Propionibacteriaceae bacterium]
MTELNVGERTYTIVSIPAEARALPMTVAILLENLIRHEADPAQIEALRSWNPQVSDQEIEFHPARVLMQDFTGVPALVDLATMREAVDARGGDPASVNPSIPTELVIDHSVIADEFGTAAAFGINRTWEFSRNKERYEFLKWGQQGFDNFKVVPPDTGIVHQVNIEHLARVVMESGGVAYPDTCVGTDSHTTMVNGLGVLGWGVGGIEAEAAMLGQPISMTVPRVIGVRLVGALRPGTTSTDLVLTIAQRLRGHGVVGSFLEFFGPSLPTVSVETRATIANMSPEYGSTAVLFPIDQATLDYLLLTGRSEEHVALVEAYAQAQGLWYDPTREVVYTETLTIDLGEVRPSISGPKRPQDRITLHDARAEFHHSLPAKKVHTVNTNLGAISSGVVAVAAITSCTNTSNPAVMIAAGLVAKKAVEKGLTVPGWVKTTLSPGSQIVTNYLDSAGLTPYLEKLGFFLVGYGCVTCIGNSGPLVLEVKQAVDQGVVACSVLSGNRNFEGRINPDVRMNYLASPPLVVAYALAGTMDIDLTTEPIGEGVDGPVYLADLWPSEEEINLAVATHVTPDMFRSRYAEVYRGSQAWQQLEVTAQAEYSWPESTYIKRAPYFDQECCSDPFALTGARVLLLLGDSVTTDHISPAGNIKASSPAGRYLESLGVVKADFNSYGSRRGNHEVMARGTFANVRLRNLMVDEEGGFTRDFTRLDGPVTTVWDAAQAYGQEGSPLVVIAGKEYGSGSSRDWAAKGPALLGVKAVIAVSFERIHRSNLVGMGIVPLEFPEHTSAKTLGLTGEEVISLSVPDCASGVGSGEFEGLAPGRVPSTVEVTATGPQGTIRFMARVRVDTPTEEAYLAHGGILPYVVESLSK